MDRNLVISASTDGSGEGELDLALVESTSPSMVRNPAPLTFGDPHVLIQSQTIRWVMRRGVTDRTMWGAIAASARNICAEMIQVDELNARLETGKLLFQRRDITVNYIIRFMTIRVDGLGSKTGASVHCPWRPRDCGKFGISLARWKGSVNGIPSSGHVC